MSPLHLLVLLLVPLGLAEDPPAEAEAATTTDAAQTDAAQTDAAQRESAPAEDPPLDPALVTWYQDMRLACGDKRTSIVARHHSSHSSEPGALVGHSVWADMARSGLVSWQAASDPRVNDKTLARTPEPADHRPLDARSSTASPQLYPELPAEVTGRIQAIELAQGQADSAWRAWQEQPDEATRAALVVELERLQGLCASSDP
jgi:hypothetical protein